MVVWLRQAELIEPAGDTSLAAGLVALLKREPDVVFVLTDGYENAPAGRFAEVIRSVRRMGVETPIHQFSPVFAAEARGIRSLCERCRVCRSASRKRSDWACSRCCSRQMSTVVWPPWRPGDCGAAGHGSLVRGSGIS